jgi:hypothetical protein
MKKHDQTSRPPPWARHAILKTRKLKTADELARVLDHALARTNRALWLALVDVVAVTEHPACPADLGEAAKRFSKEIDTAVATRIRSAMQSLSIAVEQVLDQSTQGGEVISLPQKRLSLAGEPARRIQADEQRRRHPMTQQFDDDFKNDDDEHDDFENDDNTGGAGRVSEEPGERARRLEHEAEQRKAFGEECRVMADLLRVHGALGTGDPFQTAKEWVRVFAEYRDGNLVAGSPSKEAALWLDEGWHNLDELKYTMGHGSASEITERLKELGTTVQAVERSGLSVGSILEGEEDPPKP